MYYSIHGEQLQRHPGDPMVVLRGPRHRSLRGTAPELLRLQSPCGTGEAMDN